MQILPVGPRKVPTRTWPCAGCDGQVYRDASSRGGYRHVEPLGFTHCRENPESVARPAP